MRKTDWSAKDLVIWGRSFWLLRGWMTATFTIAMLSGFFVGCDNNPPGDPCVDFKGNPKADCDGDGLSNAWELEHGYDPAKPISNEEGFIDGDHDPDEDGLPNWAEERLGLDPFSAHSVDEELTDAVLDLDGDGLSNMAEAWYGEPDRTLDFFAPYSDPSVAETHEYTCDAVDGPISQLMGERTFRFTSMLLEEPAQLAVQLHGMINAEISNHRLHIMTTIGDFSHERCAAYFNLRAGSAEEHYDEENDGAPYYLSDELSSKKRAVALHTSPTEAFFRTVDALDLMMDGLLAPDETDDREENFDLQLRNLQATGIVRQVSTDGKLEIVNAKIRAVITFEDARNTWIRAGNGVVNIDAFMRLIGGETYTRPGDDDPMGYLILGSFAAEEVELR